MTTSTAARFCAAALAALPLALVPMQAQQPEVPPRSRLVLQETIDVRVINIEVVVTDGRGGRVHGLGPQDFRVEVDGVEIPIDFFTEVVDGRAAPSATKADEEATVSTAVAAGEPVPTRYLVFIDNLFAVEQHRNEVLDALEEDIPRMGATDWMAIVSFDGLELKRLSGWENRPDRLRAAFSDLGFG